MEDDEQLDQKLKQFEKELISKNSQNNNTRNENNENQQKQKVDENKESDLTNEKDQKQQKQKKNKERSNSKEKEKDKNNKKNKDKEDSDYEREKERRKRKKKQKRKKGKFTDYISSEDEEKKENIEELKKQSKIWQNPNIPENLKQFFVEIEFKKLFLIIANIPLNIQKEEIQEYFNTLIMALRPPNLNLLPPIKSLEIITQKNFAIVEFYNSETKRICLTLENLEYKGFKLQIKKPKGFFDQIYEKSDADPYGNIITNVQEQPDNKIYMGGLPTYLTDEQVKKMCEQFGKLKYFNLVKDTKATEGAVSKGYCFFEYSDPSVADKAVKGLNNLQIADRKLKVQKASTHSSKTIEQSQNKQPSNSSGSFLGTYDKIRDILVQQMLNIPVQAITPSKVVQFLNMVFPEDLLEDDFISDLKQDLIEECSKFGLVEKIEIPRPDPETGISGPSVGKIFVKFNNITSAKQARHYLTGRTYNNRTIISSFYPEMLFDKKDFLINL